MSSDSGQRFKIKAGARPQLCEGPTCGKMIYFAFNPTTQRSTPVDLDVPDAIKPSELSEKARGQLDLLSGGETEVRDGWGGSHWDRCPDAEELRAKFYQKHNAQYT